MPEHQQIQQSKKPDTIFQKQATYVSQTPVSNPYSIIQRAKINPKSLTYADIMQLQRTIGNRAVGRLLSGIGNTSTAQQATVQRQEIPEEEEPLQGKIIETIQRQEIPEEEKPLQGKMIEAVQRQEIQAEEETCLSCMQRQEIPEEEEPIQGKTIETIQRQEIPEEEEPLQGKFENKPEIACPSCFAAPIVQRQELEEEEPLQGKMIGTVQRQEIPEEEEPLQPKGENNTGMPDNLKAGVESLSGMDMNDVRVHYNSDKPANVGALAYTQGTDIHVAPRQEKHLPHEAWHVVQQMQGRVKPTMPARSVAINDDAGLEREADEKGRKALQQYARVEKPKESKSQSVANTLSQMQSGGESTFQFVDNRPEAIAQRKPQEMVKNSSKIRQLKAYQKIANNYSTKQKQSSSGTVVNGTSAQLKGFNHTGGVKIDFFPHQVVHPPVKSGKIIQRFPSTMNNEGIIQCAGLEKGDPVPTLNSVIKNRFTGKTALHNVNDFGTYEQAAVRDAIDTRIPALVNPAPDLTAGPPANQGAFQNGCLVNAAVSSGAIDDWDTFKMMLIAKVNGFYMKHGLVVSPWWADVNTALAPINATAENEITNARTQQITAMATAHQAGVPAEIHYALTQMDPHIPISADSAGAHYLENEPTGNLTEPNSQIIKNWTGALKNMPTVKKLLEGKLFQAPTDEVELPDRSNPDEVHWMFPTYNDVKWYDDANDTVETDVPSTHAIYKTLADAWERIKALVDGRVLNQSSPPHVRVVNKDKNDFRAFQRPSDQAIFIARNVPVEIVVHEFSHHLESTIPSTLWMSLQRLLRTRNQGNITLAGIGLKLIGKTEGRFHGSMPATGEYSARAYASGDTEVMSMSMQFLSKPDTAKKLIEKDPQQAALILKVIKPTEYQIACGNTYDAYTN